MKNLKIIRIFCFLNLVLIGAVINLPARKLLLEDFNRTNFISYLGEIHNTWTVNPEDETFGIDASFHREYKNFSLKLSYDIDSALDYFFDPTYILDYSDYSIIGLSDEIPHTGYCGHYFMLEELDLTEYEYLVFFVKGDEREGYTRRFQVELKTENQTSAYLITGVTNKWKKIVIPLDVFEKIDNWKKVTEFTIVFNENVTQKKGVMYFDNIYFANEPWEIEPLREGPKRSVRQRQEEEEEEGYFNTAQNLSFTYRYTPERNNELFYSPSIVFEGKSDNVMGRLKASIQGQEFGQSFYTRQIENSPYIEGNEVEPELLFPTIQLRINRLHPLINRVTVGNIFYGYSPYIAAPFWGWRGVKVLGRKGPFEHSTFLLKRHLDSYSLGNRSMLYFGSHRLRVVGMYDFETAELPGSSSTGGTLTDTGEIDAKPVSTEYDYLVNTLFRFMDNQINLEFDYAEHNLKQKASADYTNPTHPIYNTEVSSPTVKDSLFNARLFLDGIYPGSKFSILYRDVGTDFLPKYRQQPGLFEETYADQKGYKIRMEQWYRGYNANLYWDNITRNSDSDDYTRVINFGLGYIGSRGMEVNINKEYKREKYSFPSRGIDKNIKVDSTIIEAKYNLIYRIEPGIRYPLQLKAKFRENKEENLSTNEDDTKHIFEFEIEYNLITDIGFAINYRTETNNADKLTGNYFSFYLNSNF